MTSTPEQDELFLQKAIDASQASVDSGGFPVGALIVQNNTIIAEGLSNGKALHDPTSHAETAAIRAACQKLEKRALSDCILYSSMEPCLMCFAASSWASLPKIVYAVSRDSLNPMHFEGAHNLGSINIALRKPIKLIHLSKYEPAGLKIIKSWESHISQ